MARTKPTQGTELKNEEIVQETSVKTTRKKNTIKSIDEQSEVILTAQDLVGMINNINGNQNNDKKPELLNDTILVSCRSNTYGTLFYKNLRTNDTCTWTQYGEVQEIKIEDLREMKSSQIGFLSNNRFSIIGCPNNSGISAEDIVKYLGIEKYFSEDLTPNLDSVLNEWTIEEVEEKVPLMSKGSKEQLIIMCSGMISNKEIDSLSKIRTIEKVLNFTFDLV